MKIKPPALLPILRSANQARILTELFLAPEQELSLRRLAHRAATSLPTTSREVSRAEQAGLVVTRRVGRSKVVRPDRSSFVYEPLRELLLRSFGPVRVVAEEFATVEGTSRLFIFGSWAARHLGEPGPPPEDVDVLAVGTPDRDQAYRAADRAEKRLHRPIQVTIRSRDQWETPSDDPFLETVKARPLLELALNGQDGSS